MKDIKNFLEYFLLGIVILSVVAALFLFPVVMVFKTYNFWWLSLYIAYISFGLAIELTGNDKKQKNK